MSVEMIQPSEYGTNDLLREDDAEKNNYIAKNIFFCSCADRSIADECTIVRAGQCNENNELF